MRCQVWQSINSKTFLKTIRCLLNNLYVPQSVLNVDLKCWKQKMSSCLKFLLKLYLLFYFLSWVSHSIVVIVKYWSNKDIYTISFCSKFLHQRFLKVTPYSCKGEQCWQRGRCKESTDSRWQTELNTVCLHVRTYSWMQDTWAQCLWWGQLRTFCPSLMTDLLINTNTINTDYMFLTSLMLP